MTTYLDTASGEPLHPAARAVLEQALETGFADPRRLHGPARNARIILDNAREATAEALGVRPDEVSFTSSGTQAVHLGVLGLLAGNARAGDVLVASAVEHSSVLHAGQWHQARGGRFETLPVDDTGRVLLDGLAASGPTVLAVQHANHEVGTVQPIAQAAEVGIPLFLDAGASMGRLPLPEGWSAAAGSAHKWGGPPGIGVLAVRKGTRWRNPFPGESADQFPLDGENVPLALAAAAALQAVVADRNHTAMVQTSLTAEIREHASRIPDVEVVGHPHERLPHLVTFSCLYVAGDAIVTELDRHGFAVASGSACTASTLEPSHVLAAMGVLTHGNVRVSVGRDTTPAEVHRLIDLLPRIIGDLRAEAGL